LDARFQVVLGKGGVGRTTLSAALALLHARRGERVALVSPLAGEQLRPVLEEGWGAVPERLEVVELDPRGLVDGVVKHLLPVPALSTLLTAHPAYEAVYGIAPGVKEMAVLHRLVQLAEGDARVVVDGMATGHGTHFLEAPRKSAHLLVGKLATRARDIDAFLRDAARTQVLLASTLEEMPVREALGIAAALREGGFPLGALLVNRELRPLARSAAAEQALARLATREGAAPVASEVGSSWRSLQDHARAALHLQSQAAEMQERLPELLALGLPTARVPLVPAPGGRLRAVADALEAGGL
jgi:anion-transporting  ArsA/GET3 family ATPase